MEHGRHPQLWFHLLSWRRWRRLGLALGSEPILTDARCGLVWLYRSLLLLISSAVGALVGLPFLDAVGALGLMVGTHFGPPPTS